MPSLSYVHDFAQFFGFLCMVFNCMTFIVHSFHFCSFLSFLNFACLMFCIVLVRYFHVCAPHFFIPLMFIICCIVLHAFILRFSMFFLMLEPMTMEHTPLFLLFISALLMLASCYLFCTVSFSLFSCLLCLFCVVFLSVNVLLFRMSLTMTSVLSISFYVWLCSLFLTML